MKEIWNWIQVAFATIGGTLGWFLGGLDGFLYALIAFVVVDYITGVLRAIVEKKLSSRIGAQGIAKKVALFLVVGIGHLIDTYLLGGTGAHFGRRLSSSTLLMREFLSLRMPRLLGYPCLPS